MPCPPGVGGRLTTRTWTATTTASDGRRPRHGVRSDPSHHEGSSPVRARSAARHRVSGRNEATALCHRRLITLPLPHRCGWPEHIRPPTLARLRQLLRLLPRLRFRRRRCRSSLLESQRLDMRAGWRALKIRELYTAAVPPRELTGNAGAVRNCRCEVRSSARRASLGPPTS